MNYRPTAYEVDGLAEPPLTLGRGPELLAHRDVAGVSILSFGEVEHIRVPANTIEGQGELFFLPHSTAEVNLGQSPLGRRHLSPNENLFVSRHPSQATRGLFKLLVPRERVLLQPSVAKGQA